MPGTAIVLLLIGLPIVLATAFLQEGGPRRSGSYPGVTGLKGLETGSPVAREPAPAQVAEPIASGVRLFTWSRALTAGILAFAALGLAATGFMGMRSLGIGPAGTLMAREDLGERDLIVADFRNATRDSLLGGVVTEALRIDLGQSRVVRVAEPTLVNDVLRRMERDPGVAFDRELARELAVREGLKAVLAGEIDEVRGGYILTAEVLAAEDGRTLASFREGARDSSLLIDAIGSLSAAIREKVGESLGSTRASEPLERVTTASLPALRTFTQALQGQQKEGDDAVMARSLLDQAARELERQDRAGALQMRALQALSETMIFGDTAAASRLDRTLSDYPLDALDPLDRPYPLLAETYVRAGRIAEARRLLAEYERLVPAEVRGGADFWVRRTRALMEAAGGNAGAIEELTLLAETEPCILCSLPDLGLAYEASGRPEEARAAYSRFLETPEFYRVHGDAGSRALVLESTGRDGARR